jgi:hypothetical protein
MKLQYVSNIFANTAMNLQKLKPLGNRLALLGNIGNIYHYKTHEYLQDCSHKFDKVYWVPGVLEFTTRRAKTMGHGDELYEVCHKYKNIIPMIQRKEVLPNGTHILGTTLWSSLPRGNTVDGIKHWDRWFHEDLEWLRRELFFAPDALILTHHSPVFKGNYLKETDLSGFIKDNKNISAWLYGYGDKSI